MQFPQYVTTNERAVEVVGFVDKTESNKCCTSKVFKDGKGYLDENDHIWIFCGAGKPRNADQYPYFWFNDDGKLAYSEPTEIMLKAFSVEQMKILSSKVIQEKTDVDMEMYDEQEINDINASSGFFVPTIYETDDDLKVVVKATIIFKGIDINRLKSKTEQKYILPNMKAALCNSTKMSTVYFANWMDLLGCSYKIHVFNRFDNTTDPLKHDLVYNAETSKISYIDEHGNEVDLDTGTYVKKHEGDKNEND